MFERFTERARQVIIGAQDTARELDHAYIGTEHLLAGCLREEEGLAARVLESNDVTTEWLLNEIKRVVGTGTDAGPKEVEPGQSAQQIPFTPRTKRCLELALREALSLGHNYIGTEHVLLGILREKDGVGNRMLAERLDTSVEEATERIRDDVIRMLRGPGGKIEERYRQATEGVAAAVSAVVEGEAERIAKAQEAKSAMLAAAIEVAEASKAIVQGVARPESIDTMSKGADARLEAAAGHLRRARIAAE